MQKRFDENVARVVDAVKERELRAQLEKSTRRKIQDVRREARDDLNAAVVQTLSESQADLGLAPQASAAFSADQLQPGARIRVRGFNKPVVLRRLDGSSAEIEAGPLRMKIAVDEIIGVEGAPAGKNRRLQLAKILPSARKRRERRLRRNQCDRLHGGRSHRTRRQIPGRSRAGQSRSRAHHSRSRHRARFAKASRNFFPRIRWSTASLPKPTIAAAKPSRWSI